MGCGEGLVDGGLVEWCGVFVVDGVGGLGLGKIINSPTPHHQSYPTLPSLHRSGTCREVGEKDL